MKIGINVSFLRKPATGIGQVAFNYLKILNNFQSSGSVIPAQKTGSRIVRNSIPSVATDRRISNFRDDRKKYFLYAEEDFDLKLNEKFVKRVFLPLYKRDDLIRKIWWEKFCLPKKIECDGCRSFISLYQCPTIFPKNIKHTMVVHDIIPKLFSEYLNNWRKKLYWKLIERAIKRADKIIAISEHTKKDLVEKLQIPVDKISVRYLDVDLIYKEGVSETESERVLKKYNLEKGYIYCGGGLDKRKNIERLLRAYRVLVDNSRSRIVRNSIPSVATDRRISNFRDDRKKNIISSYATGQECKIPTLVISGKLMPKLAPLVTDVEKLVKDLGLENKVRLLDFVEQEDLPALYKNAKMFIYPSLYEGFGLPVLEAMNCGVPVICSNSSSLPEVGGEAVEYFNPTNTNELAEKISLFLKDDNLRNEFIAKGKIQAKKFSWGKFVS